MTTRKTRPIMEASRLTKDEWRSYTKTVWQLANVTDKGHPAVFPAEIPHRLIKMFTFVGEVVLDPFAGAGTTGRAALKLHRKAICIDQSTKYVARIMREDRSAIIDGQLEAHAGDCRQMGMIESDSIDLIVTSPPYWNKANYGRSRTNIGRLRSYTQFLGEMRTAFSECFRVLRPGRKLCVVTANVNQYTDYGLLTFPIPADFTTVLRDIGFVMVNEAIWSKDGTGGRWGSWGAQRPIFGSYPYPPNFLFKNVHEHILIFAKPPLKKVRNHKAISYRHLMTPVQLGLNGHSPRDAISRGLSLAPGTRGAQKRRSV